VSTALVLVDGAIEVVVEELVVDGAICVGGDGARDSCSSKPGRNKTSAATAATAAHAVAIPERRR
jgi:hypothetical protein